MQVPNVGHVGYNTAPAVPAENKIEQAFEAMLQARFASAGKDYDDDDDGQVELLTEYLDGSHESRCAATQLRQMAEDAEAGLPRAVLETVADLVHAVSGCDGPTRLQARLQPIDWETVQVDAEMLYLQRSTGKLRACTLSARGPLSPELSSVTVRFLRCGATKQVQLVRASLYEMEEELVDMPYDYSVAHSGWENVDDDKRRDANSPID